jgi:hypothetical protein
MFQMRKHFFAGARDAHPLHRSERVRKMVFFRCSAITVCHRQLMLSLVVYGSGNTQGTLDIQKVQNNLLSLILLHGIMLILKQTEAFEMFVSFKL